MQSLLKKVTVCLFVICCLSALGWAAPSDPNIIIAPSVISIVAYDSGDNPAPTVLTLTNEGGSTSNWSIDTASKPDWIAIAPTSGAVDPNQNESITLTYDISSLASGSYSYAFDIIDPAAENSPQTVTVSLTIGGNLYVPQDYPTIQEAIDAAEIGDTIIVTPGTYYENIYFTSNKDIILTSIDPTNPDIVASTIIDGNGNDSVVTFSGDETSACKLNGFKITNGYAGWSGGGGVSMSGLNDVIENCVITGNTSGSYGGGLFRCDGAITNCVITGNTAVNFGGGLYSCDGAITNCLIAGNTSYYDGGGLDGCSGAITNCVITRNISDSYGGGLFRCDGAITNCVITGNMASFKGGGLYSCDGAITSCLIAGNTSYYDGGGLHDCDGAITNCVITRNTSGSYGGGLDICNGLITNCIIWGNKPGQIYRSSVPTYSCIQYWTGGGTGNISDDPMFVDPNLCDLHLLPGSPCIDAGTNTPPGGLQQIDIEGTPRPFDGDFDGNPITDMGAYEYFEVSNEPYLYAWPESINLYASGLETQNLTIKNLGTQPLNWSLDLTDIPDWLSISTTSGILASFESREIPFLVDTSGLSLAGNYSYSFEVVAPNARTSPQTVTVTLANKEFGTFYVPYEYPTIQQAIDAVDPNNGPQTVVVMPGTYYGRVYLDQNVTLTSIAPEDTDVIDSTIIDGGTSSIAVYFNSFGYSDLKGFTITNDGAIGIQHGFESSIIENCIITGCRTGIVYYGGALRNCTIADNLQYGLSSCRGSLTNCIIWGNNASNSGVQLYNYKGSKPTYSCIQNWTEGGTGNITSDPLFADPDNGDYHLKSQFGRWDADAKQWVNDDMTSPCIDAGDPSYVEWQNELWPHGKRINMGAYGGTAAASMSSNPIGSVADLNHDDTVSIEDLALFSDHWMYERHLLDTDFNLDGTVNVADFAELASQWLWIQGATLWIPDPSVSFVVLENGPSPDLQSLIISNSGVLSLNWIIDDTGIPEWLTIEKTNGVVEPNQQDSVLLSVDNSALSAGLYHTEFDVIDLAAQNSLRTVTVDLKVIGPILSVSSNELSFLSITGGANPAPEILTISNLGGSILNWQIADSNGIPPLLPDWLFLDKMSGQLEQGESEDVALSIDITGLSESQYSLTFELVDSASENIPQTITIILNQYPSFSGGTGTPEDPLLISKTDELLAIGSDPFLLGMSYRLINDLDLFGYNYRAALIAPDIYASSEWDGTTFTGSFDGNGHVISNLKIIYGRGFLGLIGRIGTGGSVSNLGMVNVDVTGDNQNIGGLCGWNDGNIINCYTNGSVTGTGSSNWYIGGLCGQNRGNITQCYSTSQVYGRIHAGGFCAINRGTIVNCYSVGLVDGPSEVSDLGGFVQYNYAWGEIVSCYFLNTSGPDTGCGTPLTNAQMKQQASFSDWDFVYIWMLDEGLSYPYLQWE